MESRVELRFRYTEQDIVQAMRAHNGSRLRFGVDVVVALVVTGAGVYFWVSGQAVTFGMIATTFGAFFGIIMLAAFYVVPMWIVRHEAKYREPYELTFSTEGIHFRTANVDSRIQWNTYTQALMDSRAFLIYY